MRRRLSAVVGVGISLVVRGTMPVVAHHSFATEFDANKPVQLEGTVTKMEWTNPHSWIHIDVIKPDGTLENWAIEGGSPSSLVRRGLRKSDLPAGTKIKVIGFRARDGGLRANGKDLTLADGRSLFFSGAPDAPEK